MDKNHINSSELTPKWPDDLVMSYEFSHHRTSDREEFTICKDSSVWDSRVQGHHNRWVFKTDPKKLDELYAHFLKEDVTTIKTKDGFNVYWSGNKRMHVVGGGTNFEIVESRSRFVVEDDSRRYTQMASRISNFIARSWLDLAITIEIDLREETGDGEITESELYIGNAQVLQWIAGGWEPLARVITAPILPGTHELNGFFKVGEKWRPIRWPLKLDAEKTSFQLVLKNDSFAVIET